MDKTLNNLYYQMISKRKSFHTFTGKNKLSDSELNEISEKIKTLKPLISNCKTAFKIVPTSEVESGAGEYCILIYSEKKENYLSNVGYMGEQLDLWLTSKNIGVCWYGMGKTNDTKFEGLDFVIMIAIEKADESEFRKDLSMAERLPIEEIWNGRHFENIVKMARYAPSACNSQMWFFKCEENKINLYRFKRENSMIPTDKLSFYNQIDLGILMLFIEVCLNYEDYSFTQNLLPEIKLENDEELVSVYNIE